MAFQIKSTRGISARTGVKILGYSRSGIGKTTLIKTAPKPFALSAENGLLALRREDIPYAEIRSIADLDEAYNYFLARRDQERVQTICLDSISEVADVCLNAALVGTRDPRKAYGELTVQIMDRYRKFRDLMYRHVYFIAQQERTTDEATGLSSYGPAYPGQKLGQKTPYLFDETFQMLVDRTGKRWLRTRADFQNEAKDRSGALDEYEPADLTHVINKIMSLS